MTDRIVIKGQTGGAFLAENPEAVGGLCSVMPVATNRMLLAVSGYTSEDGMRPPAFTVGSPGVDGLYEGLYDSLLERSVTEESLLRLIFGESEGRQTHAVSRYCAALGEVLIYKLLTEEGKYLSAEDCAALMAERLSQGIDSLRDVMRSIVGPRPGSERFFAVSFLACTLDMAGDGGYEADVYAAGDFSLFLISAAGMCPLWTRKTELVMGDGFGCVTHHRVKLHPEGPFALLVLPRSICEPSAAESRNAGENPGIIWRHRMRLEEQLLRVMAASLDTADAAERLSRHFEGHHVSGGSHPGSVAVATEDCVTGALLVRGGTYEGFRADCTERVRQLEELVVLFPQGYDAAEAALWQRDENAERSFIMEAFSTRAGCLDKARDALASRVRELLAMDPAASPESWSEEGLRRLTVRDVEDVFEVYEAENTEDRLAVEANARLLQGILSEHWMTLRPILLREEASAGIAFEACDRLKKQLSALTAYRRGCLSHVETQLADHLEAFRFQAQDWIHGRGGDNSFDQWLVKLETEVPLLMAQAREAWRETAERQRTLQSAYLLERELLFGADTQKETGAWHSEYENILRGTLPAEQWGIYLKEAERKAPAVSDILRMAETLSRRNGMLLDRVKSRAAEQRTVRQIGENEQWLVACVQGALVEDEGWGSCRHMIDQGFRNEYKAFVRRLKEEQELMLHQKEAYAEYHAMYTAYEAEDM